MVLSTRSDGSQVRDQKDVASQIVSRIFDKILTDSISMYFRTNNRN